VIGYLLKTCNKLQNIYTKAAINHLTNQWHQAIVQDLQIQADIDHLTNQWDWRIGQDL